jgi:pimeloyl-ACP methyl ester carboxylesterase
VNGRDTNGPKGPDGKPTRVARAERIDLSVLKDQRTVAIPYDGGTLDSYEIGNPKNAKFAVVFIHGGGDLYKEIGANDKSFGGNFYRLKNLASKNGGVYYSPTVLDDRAMPGLMKKLKIDAPNAKVIFVCGSAGSHTCWNVARNKELLPQLGGLILQGGASSYPDIANSAMADAKIPVIFSHGTKDPLIPTSVPIEQYKALKKRDAKYPVRMELFEGGKHGTPIRMMDYKETLEWIWAQNAANRPEVPAAGASGAAKPAAGGATIH